MRILTATNSRLIGLSLLLLRCTIGVILFMTGAGKAFKWFGGFGLEATLQGYAGMGFSAGLAYLSIYTELIGGALLIIGLLTRLAAVPVFINMLVAFLALWPKGFLMGMAAYPFSLMVIALVILLCGPMDYSLDFLLAQKKQA